MAETGGGLWSAVTHTGGILENYCCVKPTESTSAISVLVAVAYEVGQRGPEDKPNMCVSYFCIS